MFKKITIAILLGIVLTIFYAQFDQWVHTKIVLFAQKIALESLECTTTFTVQSLNFFSPTLVLLNVEMTSLGKNAWSWKCKKCIFHFSWIDLLLKGILERHIIMEDFECSSTIQDKILAIEPHIISLMEESLLPIPAELKSIIFKNAFIFLESPEEQIATSFSFNSSSLHINNQMRTTMSINDGKITYKKNFYVTDISTDLFITTWLNNHYLQYIINCSGIMQLPHMEEQGTCYIKGAINSGHGRFSLYNSYNSFIVDPIIITPREIKINAYVPILYLFNCCREAATNINVTGNAQCFVRVERDDPQNSNGHVVLQDCSIAHHHICDVSKIIFERKNFEWKAKINVARHNQECNGLALWNEKFKQGHCEFHNSTQLTSSIAPYWKITPKNFAYHAWFNNKESSGVYCVKTENVLNNTHHYIHGGFSSIQGVAFVNGLIDATEFNFKAHFLPTFYIKECFCIDKDKKSLVALKQSMNDPQSFQGDISFTFIRGLINNFFNYDIQGEGIFNVQTKVSSDEIITDISLDEATIRLPETYNFIDGFHSRICYQRNKNMLQAKNSIISLHTGKVECKRADVSLNENGQLLFANAPFILDKCLFNIKKDLFAIVSGSLFYTQSKLQSPLVQGSIILDRAQLKENIFSNVIQKQLLNYTHSIFSLPTTAVACDLTIETKAPIKVDTAFLQTNAKVNLHVQKNITNPEISGTITLQSGNLIFPYKPLFITKGILTFSPTQLLDPTIELVCQNKIKKYDVSLQIAGSLLNHTIMLDSTPPLSEEQIMALLLVGSEESSLNNMVPALIMQNLKNLIFTNNQSTFLEKYFLPLLRPFNISLIPSFADQTGRGGLRGMLEINIADRWRALIQKNFSLTEDTRLELELLLSDDIAVRCIRDERRDIGGEIEMKWKF